MAELNHSVGDLLLVSQPGCEDDHEPSSECRFDVAWEINLHMKAGSADTELAQRQHHLFVQALEEAGARVVRLPFVHAAYDSVFTKDNALLMASQGGLRALLASPLHRERQQEQATRALAFRRLGFEVHEAPDVPFEGGDLIVLRQMALLGFGCRSSWRAAPAIEAFLDATVLPIELTDPYLYHLDTALSVLRDGTALLCREAFTLAGLRALDKLFDVHFIPRDEAMRFALNIVEVGDTVIVGSEVPETRRILEQLGRRVMTVNLSEFQRAGGSAACLVSRVHQRAAVTTQETAAIRSTSP